MRLILDLDHGTEARIHQLVTEGGFADVGELITYAVQSYSTLHRLARDREFGLIVCRNPSTAEEVAVNMGRLPFKK